MNKYVVIATGCMLAMIMTGCATSQKVKTVEIGDDRLTCTELRSELKKLDEAKANIDEKKGVTGTNVAAFLFWLPGLAYTYYDASQAEEAIEDRRSNLNTLYNQKECSKK